MPRVSADEKERSHVRIVKEGAVLLRSQGLENTSLSDVMHAAGLTHGGFYRHFKSKNDLVASAMRLAVKESMSGLEAACGDSERAKALWEYIDIYLSLEHVRNPGAGCPLAALSVDAGRAEPAIRQVAHQETQHVIAVFSRAMGETTEAVGDKAQGLLALLIGTVSLARVSNSDDDAEKLLNSARKAVALLIPPRPPK